MTISATHTFVSAKAQSADGTVVSKNEWNAEHTLSMATGRLLGRTTAGAGTFEEITPLATDFTYTAGGLSLGSGLITVLAADFVGNDSALFQPVFAAAQDRFTAEASTDYTFEAFYHITRAAGTNSHTTAISLDGTATFTSIRYHISVSNPTGLALGAVSSVVAELATGTIITAANTSATENLYIRLLGNMRVNGAGTILPQFAYSSAPGGAPTIKKDSFFRMRKIGTNAFTNDSNWA